MFCGRRSRLNESSVFFVGGTTCVPFSQPIPRHGNVYCNNVGLVDYRSSRCRRRRRFCLWCGLRDTNYPVVFMPEPRVLPPWLDDAIRRLLVRLHTSTPGEQDVRATSRRGCFPCDTYKRVCNIVRNKPIYPRALLRCVSLPGYHAFLSRLQPPACTGARFDTYASTATFLLQRVRAREVSDPGGRAGASSPGGPPSSPRPSSSPRAGAAPRAAGRSGRARPRGPAKSQQCLRAGGSRRDATQACPPVLQPPRCLDQVGQREQLERLQVPRVRRHVHGGRVRVADQQAQAAVEADEAGAPRRWRH